MANKDYYKILGVNKNASEDEIKKAFRTLAHKHHPDKTGGDSAKFKEINEANQVLSDKAKRAQYDQYGSEFVNQAGAGGGYGGGNPFAGGAGAGGGFEFNFGNMEDMGDLFGNVGEMFGFGGGGRSRGGARVARGEDIAVDVELSLHDAVFGVEETFHMNKLAQCTTCSGSGAAPGSSTETCKQCGGHGQVTRIQNTILGAMQTAVQCPDCHGAGKKPEKACSECRGTGTKKRDDEITIKIPAGIHQGETIRVSGRGAAAAHGGTAGDLYVRVHVRREKDLDVEGDEIYSTAHISFPTATLGGEVETKTVEGMVTVKIPEGVQSGELIRLKHKGGMRRGGARADHFVRVIVDTPKKVSRSAKKLLEELQKELE
jgi:molecular chaperone DnaJ